jgi:aspartate/methionine/tyrosine aminotransferase
MFSTRLPPHAETNRLTRAIAAMRARGEAIVDLTESNPTQVDLPYPPDLLAPLADPRALRYEPDALGLASARAAVAADHARRGATIDPAHVVLSASTSEAYTWLFKLLCAPGECVLVPRPSYPLFEHLTRLEGIRAEPYNLEYHGRWEIDFGSLAHAPADARALLVVSPNNPTGSYVSAAEVARLTAFCRGRGCALVADEVFADYPLAVADPLTDLATRVDVLAFTLGGLSKTVGLPQLKLGWMVVGGPAKERDRALGALELIADSFLSIGTPVQIAAPALLARAAPVRAAIHARVKGNLDASRRAAAEVPACEVLRVEGGWSAVVRIPATRSEEQFVLDLLEHERILVHPGYFFDFCSEAFVVVSLLPREEIFAQAFARVLHAATP